MRECETIQTFELALAFGTARVGGVAGLFYNVIESELRRAYFFPSFQSDYFQNVPGTPERWVRSWR